MEKIHCLEHPLIQHKVSLLRNQATGSKDFRALVKEIAMLMTYESCRDIPLQKTEIQTPICKTQAKILDNSKIVIVPILRAGLGMVEGIQELIPTAKVGHIGLFRDEETLIPVEYYFKLPPNTKESQYIVLDPMLATGGSAIAAIQLLKNKGIQSIKFMCLIAAPEGIENLSKAHPDVDVYIAAKDECLNENGYIVPGLGDAGDRIFGTK